MSAASTTQSPANSTPFVAKLRLTVREAIRPALVSLGVALTVFAVLNAPLLISNLLYYGNRLGITGSSSNGSGSAVQASAPIASSPTLIIAKLKIRVPIIFDQSGDNTTIETELKNGVVQYAGTALPGQPGNVAIFGHSSNNIFSGGKYKFIFTLLDKLRPGDIAEIDFQGARYLYRVASSQVVPPTDSSVLAPSATPTLTLITCSPVGTDLNRLIVRAEQISPTPTANAQAPITPNGAPAQTLPIPQPAILPGN